MYAAGFPQGWSSIKSAARFSSMNFFQEWTIFRPSSRIFSKLPLHNRIHIFFKKSFRTSSPSQTSATSDLSFKKFVLQQEQKPPDFSSRFFFSNQRCSSIIFKNSFTNQEHTYQIFLQRCSSINNVAAGFLSPLIFSMNLHKRIWQQQALLSRTLSSLLFLTAHYPLLFSWLISLLSRLTLSFSWFQFSAGAENRQHSFSLTSPQKKNELSTFCYLIPLFS